MTFKELTRQLQQDGWRAYHIPSASNLVKRDLLGKLANRNLLEVQVYENQDVVFVKTIHIPIDVQNKNQEDTNESDKPTD